MTKRIFRSICFVAVAVFLASAALFMGVLYEYFGGVQRNQLKMQTNLAARALENEGLEYLKGLDATEYRITWIGTDGAVLYDSKSNSDEMENHLEREEIKQALAEGVGESSRYSSTLMERALYCAERLPDGTVLRLSISQNTLLTLLLGMVQPIGIIFVIAVVLSLVLASRLSKSIVSPLNDLDLENPLSNEGYDELSPLLGRIDNQQRQIKGQREELKQKQNEFEAVTENMAEGIILLNDRERILTINPAARRLFETDDSCIGQHILSVNRSIGISDLLFQLEKGMHGEKVIDLAGGRYQLEVSPVVSGSSVSGAVLLALDVTEKERAEQIRREFTANVSHELKTPLHAIAGRAELLEEGMVKEGDMTEFYHQIHAEAKRLIYLVEDIIRLSQLDEGADGMGREDTDLYALAQETIKRLAAERESANVTITVEGEPARISGIPQLLQSIVYNLCDNAIKYNHSGGTVAVTVKREGESVVFSVSDTGIGISPEHQERIFERFYQVDKSRSRELGGTGLGLSIVKHAVKLHNARLELVSAVNRGTTITVVFPCNPW